MWSIFEYFDNQRLEGASGIEKTIGLCGVRVCGTIQVVAFLITSYANLENL